MTRLRIGVLKPDWGASGGFERLLERLLAHLRNEGHSVVEEGFPGLISPRGSWGVEVTPATWAEHPEFFRYLALSEDVRRLDLGDYDLVISTQPPTYLADHPRVLALFYHHARIFYELEEPFTSLGLVEPALHHQASTAVRELDQSMIGGVSHFLAGSSEVSQRLDDFWGVKDGVSLLHAPPLAETPSDPPAWNPRGPVVCVSRHEWPKRTEYMVAAAQLLETHTVMLIGGGGQIDRIRALDRELTRDGWDGKDAAGLWRTPTHDTTSNPAGTATASILGAVDNDQRNRAYAEASVVVAPAFREDYGLTALEAMQWQRPLIVCSDGGGLVDIVSDTGAGLVVEPTPQAIADGVQRIVNDPGLAAELIGRCRAVPEKYSWARCHAELDAAVSSAMSTSAER